MRIGLKKSLTYLAVALAVLGIGGAVSIATPPTPVVNPKYLVPNASGECPACYTIGTNPAYNPSDPTEPEKICIENPPTQSQAGEPLKGNKIMGALNKLTKFMSGGSAEYDIKVPDCSGSAGASWKAYEEFPEKQLPTEQFLHSGRKMTPPSDYLPIANSSGNYSLLNQYHPTNDYDAMSAGSTVNNSINQFIDSERNSDRDQWRGNCGRGIFLYETLPMKNSNFVQKKAKDIGGSGYSDGCENISSFGDFNSGNGTGAKCRVDVEDVKRGILKEGKYGVVAGDAKLKPKTWDNDIWFSRTGCFNPEERFVVVPTFPTNGSYYGIKNNNLSGGLSQLKYFEPDFSDIESILKNAMDSIISPDTKKYPGPLDEPLHYRYSKSTNIWKPVTGNISYKDNGVSKTANMDSPMAFFVPNDRILMRNPACVKLDSSTPNYNLANKFYGIKTKNIDRDPESTRKLIQAGRMPMCLETGSPFAPGLGDIIDETDNFCKEFLSRPGQNKVDRYYLSGNCWDQKSVVLSPSPYDHWMPQAIKASFRTYEEFNGSPPTATPDPEKLSLGAYKKLDSDWSYFWRATSGMKWRSSIAAGVAYEKEPVQYKNIQIINHLNRPTFTPHSLKNAYASGVNPAPVTNGSNPDKILVLPTTLNDLNTEINCVIEYNSNGGQGLKNTTTTSQIPKCLILTNMHIQGEFGYLDKNIERGPFTFKKLVSTKNDPANSSPGDYINNPYTGNRWFTFDQAAQFLREGTGTQKYEKSIQNMERDFRLDYLPGRLIPIDYAFNPYNIYAPNASEYPQKYLNKPEFYGRKYKLQQCLRLFVEKWAFEGDKGNIVLNNNNFTTRNATTSFTPDVSYCQWAAYYAADSSEGKYQKGYEKTIIDKAFKNLFDGLKSDGTTPYTGTRADGTPILSLRGLFGSTSLQELPSTYGDGEVGAGGDTSTYITRPLNSEFYDYLNFVSMGGVELADESGCQTLNCMVASQFNLGSLFTNVDVPDVVKQVGADPKIIKNWQAGAIDMAKRDCNSLVPPNYWRDAVRPFQHCSITDGGWKIQNPLKVLFCMSRKCADNVELSAANQAFEDSMSSMFVSSTEDGTSPSSKSNGLFKKLGEQISEAVKDISFLTTNVNQPVLSLITPVIQGIPTAGIGFKFPTDGSDPEASDDFKDSTGDIAQVGEYLDVVKDVKNCIKDVTGGVESVASITSTYNKAKEHYAKIKAAYDYFKNIKDTVTPIPTNILQLEKKIYDIVLGPGAFSATMDELKTAVFDLKNLKDPAQIIDKIENIIDNTFDRFVTNMGNIIDDARGDPSNNEPEILEKIMDIGDALLFIKDCVTTKQQCKIKEDLQKLKQGLSQLGSGSNCSSLGGSVSGGGNSGGGSTSGGMGGGGFGKFTKGGTGGSDGDTPDTGTLDAKIMYVKYSVPPFKLIVRDNWLSRMGGIRVVPYSLLDNISGNVDSPPIDDTTTTDDKSNVGGIVKTAFSSMSGLPVLNIGNASGSDWIDSSFTSRSCQHTIYSAMFSGFNDKVSIVSKPISDALKEVWSGEDDISLAQTASAYEALSDSLDNIFKTKPVNIGALMQRARIYGGIRVTQLGLAADGGPRGVKYENADIIDNSFKRFDRNKYRIFYSWFPSPWVFEHGNKRSFWCEFQAPYNPYMNSKDEWNMATTPVVSHYNINGLGPAAKSRPNLTYYRPERIRDGCGAFAVRATWMKDENTDLNTFLGVPSPTRCGKWKGMFGAQYHDPKIVSWRLPRFDYEFLKAFLDCTGPIRKNPPQNCFENEFASEKNRKEAWTQAGLMAAYVIACASGSCDAKKIANHALKMIDFFTRGDTWYAGGDGYAIIPVNKEATTEKQNAAENQASELLNGYWKTTPADEATNTPETKEWIQGGFECTTAAGQTNAVLGKASEELSMDIMSKIESYGNDIAGKIGNNLDPQKICDDNLPSNIERTCEYQKDANGKITSDPKVKNDISPYDDTANVKAKCIEAINALKTNKTNAAISSMNLGDISLEKNDAEDNVGDLACYENAKKSGGKGCYHSGYGLDNKKITGNDSQMECQDCSMQIKDFWRIKKSEIKDIPQRRSALEIVGWGLLCGPFCAVAAGVIPKDNKHVLETQEKYKVNEPFGFWCSCPNDDTSTTRCREDMCTCDQHVLLVGRGVGKAASDEKMKKQLKKQIEDAEKERCQIQGMYPPVNDTYCMSEYPRNYNKKAGESYNGSSADREKNIQALIKRVDQLKNMRAAMDNPDAFQGGAATFMSPMAICKDYGPMRRWLQCFYQARAKACPVLTREITDTEPPAGLKNNIKLADGMSFYSTKVTSNEPEKDAYGNDKRDSNGNIIYKRVNIDKAKGSNNAIRTGDEPVSSGSIRDASLQVCTNKNPSGDRTLRTGFNMLSQKFARWMAEEPNHLARLPVKYESAGAAFKHQDFVFQSQVRDIEAPFMEMAVPMPIELLSRGSSTGSTVYGKVIAGGGTTTVEANDEYAARGQNADDAGAETQKVFVKQNKAGNELAEIQLRQGESANEYSIDIGQLILPKNADGTKLNPRYWQLATKFEAGLAAANAAFTDTKQPNQFPFSYDDKHVNLRAQDAVVGPRGCDIGGWYEMMLYQARCIKFFGLNCICDYDKTFARGDSNSYALNRAGMAVDASYPVLKDVTIKYENVKGLTEYFKRTKKLDTSGRERKQTAATLGVDYRNGYVREQSVYYPSNNKATYEDAKATAKSWDVKTVSIGLPLMNRGLVGPEFALGTSGNHDSQVSRPENRLWQISGYKGLDHAVVGDIIIYDEDITYKTSTGSFKADAGYPRHAAYVERVNRAQKDDTAKGIVKGQPLSIDVSEMNWGKNLDSCGNTDTWGVKTTRTILKPIDFTTPIEKRKQYYASCQNADWAMCEEKFWDQVKIYRPYTFTEVSGKYVPKADAGYPVCNGTAGDKLNFNTIKTRANLSADLKSKNFFVEQQSTKSIKEIFDDYDAGGNEWLRGIKNFNSYDLREVNRYLKSISDTVGMCDPDPRIRDNYEAVHKDYIDNKTYLDTLPR